MISMKELSLWVNESLKKDNSHFIEAGVKDIEIHKVKSHLKSLSQKIDLITANTVKNNQYMNQVEQDLAHLTKWGYSLPGKKDVLPSSVLPTSQEIKKNE